MKKMEGKKIKIQKLMVIKNQDQKQRIFLIFLKSKNRIIKVILSREGRVWGLKKEKIY